MKLEDLNIGAVIMHSDRKENYAHTGEMWLVTKLHISKVEAICLNSRDPYRVGETGLILLKELPHYDLITTLCVPPSTKPANRKKDLYLRWAFGKKTSLGRVGDKTPYKLENGRNLFVGDVVSIKKTIWKKKTVLWCMTKMMAIMSWAFRLTAIPKQVKLRISLFLLKRVSLA